MNRATQAVLVIGAVGVVAVAVTGTAIGFGGGSPGAVAGSGPSTSTAHVTRATLTQTQQVNGTLGYGTPMTVNAGVSGVITWLPALGAVIRRGQSVYKVDNAPVVLFYGNLPLYRQLHWGSVGDDVKEVEQNLRALGYTGLTVDKTYSGATASAVRKWQKDQGLPQTGVLDPTRIVLSGTHVRVASLATHLSDHAAGPVLAFTGTTRAVSIPLDVALQNLAKPGATATVTLPDGSTVDGTVASVGTVATPGQSASDPATIRVTVTVSDQSKLGTLDQAPVAVTLVSATVANVLTVPVAALVALAEGGYGVQVIAGSTTRYLPVHLGMFGNGRVEISGGGITDDTVVAVPS